VYSYLQTTLHKYRILLLLPFLVSHCLFYLCLQYPLADSSSSFKTTPTHFATHNQSIETLQVVKARQLTKGVASYTVLTVLPAKLVPPAPAPIIVGSVYVPSHSVAAFHPPALFPTRAPPA
jgi:hypothetical protein